MQLPVDFGGVKDVVIEKAGYQTATQSITLTAGRTHQFDVPLQPIPDSSQPAKLAVIVVDKVTRQPVAGAAIALSGSNPQVLTTDTTGVAQFTGLSAGTTQVQVTASGYDNAAFVIDLVAGVSYQAPVELTPQQVGSNRLYGSVYDAQTHQPLAGAKVSLAGAAMLSTTADGSGNYEFSNLTPGHWNLSASASGYLGSSHALDLTASTDVLPINRAADN